jgi:DNA-binding PadR family transcriptional regulator
MITELELEVLLAVGHGAGHGYAIGKHIETVSAGRLDPTTGAVYQALRRLSANGLLREAAAPRGSDEDERRKYFALTASGRRAIDGELARLEQLVHRGRREVRGNAGG